MKRMLSFLVVMLFSCSMVFGVVVAGNWDVECTVDGANDFHIDGKLRSMNGQMPQLTQHWQYDPTGNSTWMMTGFNISIFSGDMWQFTADFKTNGSVNAGDIVHFGLKFEVNYSNVHIIPRAFWTKDGEKVGDFVTLLGFNVFRDTISGRVIARIENDSISPAPVRVEQLEFAVSTTEVPLEDMYETGLGNPGTTTVNPEYSHLTWKRVPGTFVLGQDQHYDVVLDEIGVHLQPNQFLVFRSFNNNVAVFGQHEEPLATR